MEQHVTVVGVLRMGFGALGTLGAIILFLIAVIVFASTVGPGVISGDEEALRILTAIGSGVGLFLSGIALFVALLSVFGIIGGIGLHPDRNCCGDLLHLGAGARRDGTAICSWVWSVERASIPVQPEADTLVTLSDTSPTLSPACTLDEQIDFESFSPPQSWHFLAVRGLVLALLF